MRSVRFVIVTTLVTSIISVASASAQTGSPKLEIGTKQGDYYWVVETSPDGARRGGWVNVAVPINAIDRSALKPLPPVAPSLETSVQPPPAPTSPAIDARTEPAMAAKQGTIKTPATSEVRPIALTQVSQPSPDPIAPIGHGQTREGFWFNAGFGYGSLSCLNCDGYANGFSGGIALGGTLNEKLLLGVGTTGWYRAQDGVWLNVGTLDARLRFYPSTRSGFFINGGLGLGTISLGVTGIGSESETGVGLMLGVGWDLRVGRNVSLTPFWNGSAVRTANADASFGQIGLGITVH
jgi:hypothetical protein